jgi:Ribosomal protein L7/L12
MINTNIKKIFAVTLVLILSFIIFACQQTTSQIGKAQTPTEAYKMLYAAVKSKNPDEIRKMLSANTFALAEFQASRTNQEVNKVIANGFTETTYSASLPQIRDERVKDSFGAVEVWNEKNRIWEDLPFIMSADLTYKFTGEDKTKINEAVKDVLGIEVKEEGNTVQGIIKGVALNEMEKIKQQLSEAGAEVTVENEGWRLAVGDLFKGTYESPGKSQSFKEREAANLADPNRQLPQPDVNTANVNVNRNVPQPPSPKKEMQNRNK